MALQYGFLKKEWAEDLNLIEVPRANEVWWHSLPQVAQIRMAMGLAWEQWYLPQLDGVVHQPGEMCLEGVYMSPDGESIDFIHTEHLSRYMLALHEVKLTYKSVNTVGDLSQPLAEWLWKMQIKAYAKAKGALIAYLHILYACGDYSYPIQPQLHIWRFAFEQAELDEAWDLVRDFIREHPEIEAYLQGQGEF